MIEMSIYDCYIPLFVVRNEVVWQRKHSPRT